MVGFICGVWKVGWGKARGWRGGGEDGRMWEDGVVRFGGMVR